MTRIFRAPSSQVACSLTLKYNICAIRSKNRNIYEKSNNIRSRNRCILCDSQYDDLKLHTLQNLELFQKHFPDVIAELIDQYCE
jgi:hypothetical protein